MHRPIKSTVTDKIDPKSLVAIVVVGVVELELFNFAELVTKKAGNDAWLSVILGSILSSLITFVIVRLALRFPRENLWQYSVRVWSKPLTYVMALTYFIFWAVLLIVMLRSCVELNDTFFLREAPPFVTLIVIQIGAAALVLYGLAALVRHFQLMFPFLMLPLLLTSALSIENIKLGNFMPFLGAGMVPVLKGALVYVSCLQGLEALLFIIPFLNHPEKALKSALLGINIINVLAVVSVITAIGVLGVKATQQLTWPNISMLGVLEIPLVPTERFDLWLTFPTLIGVFTTICLVFYLLSYGIVQIFGITNKKPVIISLATVTAAATYLIPNFAWTMKIRSIIDDSTLVFILLIPLLTLIVSLLRGKKGEKS